MLAETGTTHSPATQIGALKEKKMEYKEKKKRKEKKVKTNDKQMERKLMGRHSKSKYISKYPERNKRKAKKTPTSGKVYSGPTAA